MPRRTLAVALPAAALLGIAAVPGAATAATIVPAAGCYAHVPAGAYQPITGTITGGPAGGRFQIFGVGGKASDFVGNYDASGNAPFSIDSYSLSTISPSKGQTIPLSVNEFTPQGTLVTANGSVKVTTIALDINIKRRSPFARATWTVSGVNTAFGPGTLYASYTKGTKSRKVVKTIKLGTAKGACGYLRTKKVPPPGRKTGTWTIWVHPGKAFAPKKSAVAGIRVYRSF